MFEPPKHNDCVVIPLKYMRIHFTAIQFSLPGLFIYLLTTPTACAIFGLVHTIACILTYHMLMSMEPLTCSLSPLVSWDTSP